MSFARRFLGCHADVPLAEPAMDDLRNLAPLVGRLMQRQSEAIVEAERLLGVFNPIFLS